MGEIRHLRPAPPKDPRARVTKSHPAGRRKPKQKNPEQIVEQHIVNLNQKRRAKSRNRALNFVSGLFFIVVLFYIVQQVTAFATKPKISTEVVRTGSIDRPRVINALIVRDETVYSTDKAGVIYYDKSEGERVKKGMRVCSVQDEAAVAKIQEELSNVDKDILQLQERREDISGANAFARRINQDIKDEVDNRIIRLVNANIDELYTLRQALSQEIEMRNSSLLGETGGSLKELSDKRKVYTDQMLTNMKSIKAEQSGIVSYFIDGLESRFNFSNVHSLTKDDTTIQSRIKDRDSENNVNETDEIFKIITSNKWYIAAYIPNDQIPNYSVGDTKNIFVERNGEFETLNVKVEDMAPGDDETFCLFSQTKYMTDFLEKRSIKIKTLSSVYTGLKVPTTAISKKTLVAVPSRYLIEEAFTKVEKMVDGKPKKVNVSVITTEGDLSYVLSRELQVGEIVVNPKASDDTFKLVDILQADGVFKVNRGTANFARIFFDDETPRNSGYIILDQEKNHELSQYDSIVTDAEQVYDGQIIY